MKKQIITAILLTTGIVGSIFADFNTYFTEATNTGITPEPTADGTGYSTAAFGDYNNDGFLDIAVTEFTTNGASNGKMLIFTNTPSNPGHFTAKTLTSSDGPARQVAWGDFDNDGDLDLFADVTTHNYLWKNSGYPDFNLELVGGSNNSDAVLPATDNEQGAGWVDINQDGKLDLFVTEGGHGGGYIHRNTYSISDSANPSSWFESIEPKNWDNSGSNYMPNGSYSMAGDFDNDGKPDIFYSVDATYKAVDTLRVWVWHNSTLKNSSTFSFDEVGRTVLNNPYSKTQPGGSSIQWSGVMLWDADNDGDLDLFVGWGSGYDQPAIDQFYKNTCGYNTKSDINNIFEEQTNQDFADGSTETYSGGVTAGDIDNNGFMDLYVVHGKGENHKLYINNGNLSFSENVGIKQSGYANGATFGDVDNDGDIDLFLCNGGKLFLNNTNSTNLPAHPDDNYYKSHDYTPPTGSGNEEYYFDIMVSGASTDSTGKTKDGIGSRVYLFKMNSPTDKDTNNYGASHNNLVGMREIDGGSGYGSQATQVQHFGLNPTLWGANPHKQRYAIKVRFLTGEVIWKWNKIPDEENVKISYGSGSDTATTWLAQTIEVSLLDLRVPEIASISINADPAKDTMNAGDTKLYWAEVKVIKDGDTVNGGSYYTDNITWHTEKELSTVEDGTYSIDRNTGDSTTFTGTEAYAWYRVIAELANPDSVEDVARDTARIWITAGTASQLFIEGSPEKPTDRQNLIKPNPLAQITISKDATTALAYGILRDKYGNWAGPAINALWNSKNESVATADKKDGIKGEGEIIRVANSGETQVYAIKNSFSDSVTVTLSTVSYSELQIINTLGDKLTSLTMRADEDTTLKAIGLNSVGHWDTLAVKWDAPGLNINSDNLPPNNAEEWRVVPAGSGKGFIKIAYSDIKDSIPVTLNLGLPDTLVIYDSNGNRYKDPNYPLSVKAGNNQNLIAKMFDKFGELISDYSDGDLIGWSVKEETGVTNESGSLSSTTGKSVIYTPKVALRTVLIIAKHSTKAYLADTVKMEIGAGDPYQLFIEGTKDAGTVSPNTAKPIENAYIYGDQTETSVYAVIRDKYGNYVQMSKNTTWWEKDDSIADAKNGNNESIGEGLLVRKNNGTTQFSATNTKLNLTIPSDTADVIVKDYHYTNLRILDKNSSDIDTLEMTTNDDVTLKVEGQRSSDGGWEAVDAQWELSSGLITSPLPPKDKSWTFSPKRVGQGWIRASLESDKTKPDTVGVNFTVGKPQNVIIRVTADRDSIIAGTPIPAIIEIENRWGKVPGSWCEEVVFSDLVDIQKQTDLNGNYVVPSIIVNGDTIAFDSTISNFCFKDGIASVNLLMYYAPPGNSNHEILVNLKNTGIKDTADLDLKQGPVKQIEIVSKTNPIEKFKNDSLFLDFDGSQTIKIVGFDEYGNFIGPVYGNWRTTNTLPEISRPNNTPQIFYQVDDIKYIKSGEIIVSYVSDSAVTDTLFVTIRPKPAELISAVTKDYNGNGLLDAIVIKFDKSITFDSTTDINDIFTVKSKQFGAPNGTVRFHINEILPLDSASNTFTIYLKENNVSLPNTPQTSWTPKISISNNDEILSTEDYESEDGAGPVIWSVTKIVNSTGDRKNDKVSVAFSESFKSKTDGIFSPSTLPEDVFEVWGLDSSDNYVKLDSMLVGIKNFQWVRDDTLLFYMRNGNELTGEHLLTIKTDPYPLVKDANGNEPNTNNHKVRVIVQGTIGNIAVGPNPLIPTFSHFEEVLTYHEPVKAFDWAKNEGGAVIVTEITLSDTTRSIVHVKASLMVFDALGNLVYTNKNDDDVIPDKWRDEGWVPGTTRKLVFYWNGITNDNRRAAPGIYRTIIYIDDGMSLKKKFVGNIGIGR